MHIKNSWGSPQKQNDKIMIKVRFGKLTALDVNIDLGNKRYSVTLFNFIFRF